MPLQNSINPHIYIYKIFLEEQRGGREKFPTAKKGGKAEREREIRENRINIRDNIDLQKRGVALAPPKKKKKKKKKAVVSLRPGITTQRQALPPL